MIYFYSAKYFSNQPFRVLVHCMFGGNRKKHSIQHKNKPGDCSLAMKYSLLYDFIFNVNFTRPEGLLLDGPANIFNQWSSNLSDYFILHKCWKILLINVSQSFKRHPKPREEPQVVNTNVLRSLLFMYMFV